MLELVMRGLKNNNITRTKREFYFICGGLDSKLAPLVNFRIFQKTTIKFEINEWDVLSSKSFDNATKNWYYSF